MDRIPTPPDQPFLLVLSGPSGSGKSSVTERFRALEPEFVESVSVTTRAPRGRERDGVDYRFVDDAAFDDLIASHALLEHATVFGQHRYGTPRSFVEEQFAQGRFVITNIDVQGAVQIRDNMPARSCLVFITPPDMDELERRLRGRGTDDPEAIGRRLAEARSELAAWRSYDHLIVNHDLEAAVADLRSIVRARRLRTA
ncbi:MAG: guanylate kinase [Planctomycetota bacterium]